MKIKLKAIADRPIVQHTSTGPVVDYPLAAALVKLSSDPLSVKDRYAVGRTLTDVRQWIEGWEATRNAILREYSVTRGEFLAGRAAALRARIAEAEACEARHPALARWRESLRHIDGELQAGENLSGMVLPDDARAQCEARLAHELETECEVFLDRPVPLPAESKLSGEEMAALGELIAPPQ